MKYKINIHAHSYFSDGKNSPIVMAQEAKKLGFSVLVLTDHFYNGKYCDVGMVKEKLGSYGRALNEARQIMPVIRGMEVPFMNEEVLIFGSTAIKDIIEDNGIKNNEYLAHLKHKHNCAVILCHPNIHYLEFIDLIDGYERYNSGQDYFNTRMDSLEDLTNKQAWCNSDAHSAECLNLGYNIVDTKITTEDDLVKYIKKGRQHEHCINNI